MENLGNQSARKILLKPISMPFLETVPTMEKPNENQPELLDREILPDFAFIDLWISRLGRATDSVLGSPSSAFR